MSHTVDTRNQTDHRMLLTSYHVCGIVIQWRRKVSRLTRRDQPTYHYCLQPGYGYGRALSGGLQGRGAWRSRVQVGTQQRSFDRSFAYTYCVICVISHGENRFSTVETTSLNIIIAKKQTSCSFSCCCCCCTVAARSPR